MTNSQGQATLASTWAPGYREWLPDHRLRDAIACLWVSVTPDDGRAGAAAVMPDGCTDLIWQRGRGAFVAGPDTKPAPTDLQPGTILVGARFWPGAGGPALGCCLADLRDLRVDAADVVSGLAGRLAADLTPVAALDLMTALSAELVTAAPPDELVLTATALLASRRDGLSGLGAALAVSERQLRRRFEVAVGYGPKTLQRILRFRRVLDQLAATSPAPDLANLAIRAGYSDQAHLTRETTRLAGRPPAALARSLTAHR
ncbi:MAG TPA: helix-turn-helix domain-containing protein [Chloroflexota bacterium]